MRRHLCTIVALLVSASVSAVDWPQEIVAEEATIVVYQPQPEGLDGNVLSARAAISLEVANPATPMSRTVTTSVC